MKKLILFFFIFVYLCSFTNENIKIEPKERDLPTFSIKDCIINIKSIIEGTYNTDDDNSIHSIYEIYGFNAQNCQLRKKDSCYVSIDYEDNWYYFCGTIEENIKSKINELVESGNQEFVEAYKNVVMEEAFETIGYFDDELNKKNKKLKNVLKIDCFSKTLRYFSLFTFIYLVLLL